MKVVPTEVISKDLIRNFFIQHWGSPEMIISTGIYSCDELPGYAVIDDAGKIAGLITYFFRPGECEIISLDSIEEGKGIGSSLLQAVENYAREKQAGRIILITTNDNLNALRFYQKRGYRLAEIKRNAVSVARRLKPEIPMTGNDGIPIRDEIVLEKLLV
ncbi:GNAT family N-acetyltransferase [Bacillus sp. T33-2]|uniref:GNAT family N-acetyltransferase n=1 Tax=Bacillus sp. T33-2 TaxID=2054168 RepID=UPI000C7913C4|nr:GNAT family N-acetyltransferase [Bacillus sp. T33-2]PLR95224.1 GNAT family N-acetyltransferase [Bacillus sp. T33-2]